MKTVPTYTKVSTIGSAYTENALVGEVIVQEKVDGSQFNFGINEDGEFVARSKSVNLHTDNEIPKMFQKGYGFVHGNKEIATLPKDTYLYCEYLEKPKHNTLKYERTPKNNIVLFDALLGGKWATREELTELALKLDIDLIPELGRGTFTTDDVKNFTNNDSYLGGEKVEGVVIKNYGQIITLGGMMFPLFTKYVREEFKERHALDWKDRTPKGNMESFIASFKSEARWQKAIIHFKEQGKLLNAPQDIGPLMKEIQEDIKAEDEQTIKDTIYKLFLEDIMRVSIQGFAQWYKDKLLENVNPS